MVFGASHLSSPPLCQSASLLLKAELIAQAVSQQISIDASSYLALSPVSSLRWSLFAAGVRMSTPSQRAAIRQSVWRRRSKKGLALTLPLFSLLRPAESLSTSLPLFLFFDTCRVLAALHTSTTRMHALKVSFLAHGTYKKF